ncbi:MAG TPA: hypothetical protein VN631_11100 [Negativicutes bacterium]|nr:hypothetical protein [Negativicutes bacterium]
MRQAMVGAMAGIIFAFSSVAVAAPVEVTGSLSSKYETINAPDSPLESSLMTTLTLRAEKKIAPGLSLYTRFAAQYVTQPLLGAPDYNMDVYGPDTKTVVALDQYGLIYQKNNWTYKLGRQDYGIGVTTLLYNRADTNIGKEALVEGLSFNGAIGSVELSGVLAQENSLWTSNNQLYALRVGCNLSKNVNVGATWAQYHYNNSDTTNHWDLDTTLKFGKGSLTAEYAQSDRSAENTAYAVTAKYDFTDKTAFYITNFRVEANGDMGGQSEFNNNNRGFHYGLTHSLSDSLSLEVVYKDQYSLLDDSKNTKFETTLKYTF